MVKNLPANAGDVGSVPGLVRSPEGGNGNPLQYSCLDRGAWQFPQSMEPQGVRHNWVTRPKFQYLLISLCSAHCSIDLGHRLTVQVGQRMYSIPPVVLKSHSKMSLITPASLLKGFPGGSEVKASACNAGDLGSIPGLGRSPGEGNGNPFQYFSLENPMDGGSW